MSKDYFVRVLIVIVLALLIFLALKPDGNKKYLDLIEQENRKLSEQITQMKFTIQTQIDSIKIIEKKETIIRNYYNDIINQIENVTSDSAAIAIIRSKLNKLGAARTD